MVSDPVDLLIIGGGINGAGIARDAAMRGFRTAIVDRGDFGGETSGRSTRLVHGGLQDFEQGRFRGVFQSARERRTLLRIAPHLVQSVPFLFPVHDHSRISLWKLAAGLQLYDALTLFRNVGRHRLLGKQGVLGLEPTLRSHDLKGGAVYYDARCNDTRLTLATVRSAFQHGAHAANYVAVEDLDRADGRIYSARLTDRIDNTTYTVRAGMMINATGPWSDRLRSLDQPDSKARMARTKGSHVVLLRNRLGISHAVTMVSPLDGRIVFAIPSDEFCYVGTTETEAGADPEGANATAEDVVYLLRSTNAYFPGARLAPEDVVATWSGLRPWVRDAPTTAPAPREGEHRIFEDPSGLVSVIGGNLTTHRAVSAEVVDFVASRLHDQDGRRPNSRAATHLEPLPGGEVADLDVLTSELIRQGFSRRTAEHLVRCYGTESAAIARIVETDPIWGVPIVGSHPAIRGEVVHVVRREMAMTLADIMVRRIGLFFEVIGHGVPEAPAVVDLAGEELGWDARRKAAELAAYLETIQQSMQFRDDLPG